MTTEVSVPELVDGVAAGNEFERSLREKILFGLSIYPALSPTMLHVFLGTAIPKSIWKDVVLESLLAEGEVVKDEVTLTSPHDRTQTYTILRLSANAYTPPEGVHPNTDTTAASAPDNTN